jgi:hypothetical protein
MALIASRNKIARFPTSGQWEAPSGTVIHYRDLRSPYNSRGGANISSDDVNGQLRKLAARAGVAIQGNFPDSFIVV